MKNKKSVNILNEDKNSFFQILTNLKIAIFDVLFVVLDKTSQQQDESIISVLNQAGIDYLQMMQFPFGLGIINVWNGGKTLNSIVGIMSKVVQIQNMIIFSQSTYLIVMYLLILLIVLVIVDIIYVSYSFSKKKFSVTWPLVILAQLVPLFVTILFIPIVELLLSILNCSQGDNTKYTWQDDNSKYLQSVPQIQCFKGAYNIHLTIILLFTCVFVIISTVVAMTLFQPRMTSKSLTARRTSKGQIIFIVNKIICQFIFSLNPFNDNWMYVAMMFFPALWLFYFYHFNQPYYDKNISKLFRTFSAYYFWTIFTLSVSQILLLLKFDFQGAMVIWFCGLPFIGLNIFYESKSNIDNLFSSNLRFKTGQELQAHLNYVLLLINQRKKDENSNMLLVGYIEKHIQTCLQEDCPIKIKKLKKQQILSEMDQNCKLLIIQIQRMYKQGIKKFSSSTKLHISFAFFYMQHLKQNAKAYQQFLTAEQCNPTFIQDFIIYRFKKIIKQKLQQNKQQQSDLIQIIRFDNHVSLCEQAMIASSKLHKQFWTQLMQQTPNLDKLNEAGGNIIQIVNSVKNNYIQINKINSCSPQIIYNYGIYCLFVAQNTSEGKRCLSQAKRSYFQSKTKGDFNITQSMEIDQNNSLIVVSANASSMGKIMTVNDNFIQLSGYPKEEITQKSIDKILPQIFLFYHENAMNKWLHDSSRMYMNQQQNSYFRQIHRGFLKQKNGFIIPIFYKVNYNIFQQKFYVHFKNQKQFTQNFQFKMYIITDPKGIIKEISSLGFAHFNLSKDNLSSTERMIEELGIIITPELYTQGNLIRISKPSLKSRTLKNNEEQQKQAEMSIEQNQQFFIKAQKILMPCDNNQQQKYMSHEVQAENGKIQVGSILYLQKVVPLKGNPKDVKFQSLKGYQRQILQFYEIKENNQSDEEQQLLKNNPLVNSNIESKLGKKEMFKQSLMYLIEGKKEENKSKQIINYAGKIKTYRLINKQLKRVVQMYGQDSQAYEEVDEQNIGMSAFEIGKLKNPSFISKIKTAINTNINHKQVKILKISFSTFLVLLIAINIIGYIQLDNKLKIIQNYMKFNQQWVKDQYYINQIIHRTFNQSDYILISDSDNWKNPQNRNFDKKQINLINQNISNNHTITFDPDILVELKDQNGHISTVRLNNALLWVQGYVINYFQSQIVNQTYNILLQNYYKNIFPALENFRPQFYLDRLSVLLLFIIMFFVACLMLIIWVYNKMMIDKKSFDIILWFLDIPMTYVSYLQASCNIFIKNYTPVKELIEKGINFHNRNLYLQQYKTSSLDGDSDDKFNQQNKSRKIMIARYKKKTLLSRCQWAYVRIGWIIIYSCLIVMGYLIVYEQELSFYKFLDSLWNITGKQFLWSASIPNTLRLIQYKNMKQVNGIDLIAFQDKLQAKFLNPVSTFDLTSLYSDLLSYGTDISNKYHQFFEGDICQFEVYSETQSTFCKSFLDGKLQGGISTVFSYYSMLDRDKYEQIQGMQYFYVNTYLNNIFNIWYNEFKSNVDSKRSTLTVALSLYITLTIFGFIILWIFYLKKINIKFNQTIQMLNMIPIKMLPKSRKDIRDFFLWIIMEANKNKDQE